MEGKCPMCGAPMESGQCGYCGYKEKIIEQQAEREEWNNYRQIQPESKEEVKKQPQNIQNINYQTINNWNGVTPGVSRKDKTTALLLCIFLGWCGAHKFYVGKPAMGVCYLFTGGLCGLGWLIDIFLIASGSYKDEFGLPLR